MTDLIERIEALEGPDREVEEAVHVAFGWQKKYRAHSYCAGYDEWWERGGEKIVGWDNIPAYTSSLDAAMTLVPEDFDVALNIYGNRGSYAKCDENGIPIYWEEEPHSRGKTPALALCAAALKARNTVND